RIVAWKSKWSVPATASNRLLPDFRNPASAGFFHEAPPWRGFLFLIRAISRRCVGYHRRMTINADPQELAKFSDLAHRWWDTESEFRPLHQINPLRLDWIDRQARLAGKKVVDIGCGGGILSDSMARRGADVLGIDLAS